VVGLVSNSLTTIIRHALVKVVILIQWLAQQLSQPGNTELVQLQVPENLTLLLYVYSVKKKSKNGTLTNKPKFEWCASNMGTILGHVETVKTAVALNNSHSSETVKYL